MPYGARTDASMSVATATFADAGRLVKAM